MKKLLVLCLLFLAACGSKAATMPQPTNPDESDRIEVVDGFLLPTERYVPFKLINWCLDDLCGRGIDCLEGEQNASCYSRTLLMDEFELILDERVTFHVGNQEYFYTILSSGEEPKLLGILFPYGRFWVFTRFLGERSIPDAINKMTPHGKEMIQLIYGGENNLNYFPESNTFREERNIPRKKETRH